MSGGGGGGGIGFAPRHHHHHQARSSPWEQFLSSLASLILVLISQFTLAFVPRAFPSLSLLALLPISALVLGVTMVVCRFGRRLFGIYASAPALVVFNILFLWGVYVAVVRRAIPPLSDAFFNAECALLLIGFYWILSGDPGLVIDDLSCSEGLTQNEADLECKSPPSVPRVRYCNSCKASVKGLDHHCPAFGNCIGQKNHRLFILLVIGFVIAEASYTMCSSRYILKSLNTWEFGFESNLSGTLVISTMLFSVVQLLWQVAFLLWHIYCICVNIKTVEWINWKKYPEFQLAIQPQPGLPFSEMRFTNPYNKGFIGNIKDFLKAKD